MAITFKELSLIAELHYGKLSDPFKQKATEFFDALDQDGDGAVTLPELLDSNLTGKFGQEFIQHVFYNLDEEGKGVLEFRECLTLYYLCMYSARTCAACKKNIPNGLGYTCRTCWKEKQRPNNEFYVCLECFSSHNYQHEHGPPHLFHDFVLFDDLLHSKPISPALAPVRIVEQTVKQCVKCGDYHESGARGFTCDVHMSPMRGSPEFVCEWCFSYMCSKCGNLFRDSSTRAEPGKWLQRFVCQSCHQRNITLDCYEASIKRVQNKLSVAELLRQCRTCEIKQRNGTLFWYIKGTNTASAAAAAAPPSQPAWQAPAPSPGPRGGSSEHAPGPRPRGGSSEHLQRQAHSRNSSSGSSTDGHSFQSPQDSGSSHGGSSHGNPGRPNNRVNTQQPPPPRGAGRGAPMNRPYAHDAAAGAARYVVNRFVNAAAANIFGGDGGGGVGGGSGGGAGGVNIEVLYGGGGSGDDGVGADAGNGGGDGVGGLVASLSNLMGGGQDGGGDSGGFLSGIVSTVSQGSGQQTW